MQIVIKTAIVAIALAVAIAVPVAAQAPAGWQMRLDHSTNAQDPDDVPNVTVTTVTEGFEVVTGPAVVMWNESNTAMGTYTLEATFTQLEPSSHPNYLGLVYGAGALDGASQHYMYFLVAQDGTYLVKHRANDNAVHDVQAIVPHDAVMALDANGQAVNRLEVRVGATETQFVVNGTVVFTAPKTGMAGNTDGIWGVRINHVLPRVRVEGLRVTN